MKKISLILLWTIMIIITSIHSHAAVVTDLSEETPIFITIGQSNADGTAIFNTDEDARLKAWYDSESNPGLMKIWYRSCYINTSLNSNCWCFDGTVDVEPGWLNLCTETKTNQGAQP